MTVPTTDSISIGAGPTWERIGIVLFFSTMVQGYLDLRRSLAAARALVSEPSASPAPQTTAERGAAETVLRAQVSDALRHLDPGPNANAYCGAGVHSSLNACLSHVREALRGEVLTAHMVKAMAPNDDTDLGYGSTGPIVPASPTPQTTPPETGDLARCDYCRGVGACPRCWGRAAIDELKRERDAARAEVVQRREEAAGEALRRKNAEARAVEFQAEAAEARAEVERLRGALGELLDAVTPEFTALMRSLLPDEAVGRLFKARLAARATLAASTPAPAEGDSA